MYSIGEVSEMFDLPVSTLRYYDKEGLLIDLEKDRSGNRKFNENNLEALRVIECLKKSGMQIKDIKEFMHWCALGNKTITKRKEMFLKQKENIESEIKELQKALNMINYKCWYYTEMEKDGNEKRMKNITLKDMPKEVKEIWENAH